MTHHAGLVAVSEGRDSRAKAVGRADCLYTQHVNRRHGGCGCLWHNRSVAFALEEERFRRATRHVDQNSLRTGMVNCSS